MEPIFTKSDLLLRRGIAKTLKELSGKYTNAINTTLRELNYCLEQRLAEIEKYLDVGKGGNGDVIGQTRSRRGATMAGALEFNLNDFKYEEEANKLEQFDLEFSQGASKLDKDGLFSSRNSLNMLTNPHRDTLRKKLNDFKVTDSDQEDTDYLDESDNELEIEMKLEESKKKNRKRGSFLTDMLSVHSNQSPVRSRNITGTTFSPFEKNNEKTKDVKNDKKKLDFDNFENNFQENKSKLIRAGSISKIPEKFGDDDRFKRSMTQNEISKLVIKVTPTERESSPGMRKTSLEEPQEDQFEIKVKKDESIELPVRVSIQRVKDQSNNSGGESLSQSSGPSRKNVVVGFDSMMMTGFEEEFNEGQFAGGNGLDTDNKFHPVRNTMYPTTLLGAEQADESNEKKRKSRIFEDFNEIDGLVKELKEEGKNNVNKLRGIIAKQKPDQVSKLWKKVLKKVAQVKYLSFLGARPTIFGDLKRSRESNEIHVIGRGAGSKMGAGPSNGKQSNVTL